MSRSELPTVEDPYTGEERKLGSLPSDPRLVAALPGYTGEVLPESELRAFHDFPGTLKVKDQDGIGACFPPGTRVRMEDGSERPIESVRLLDRVVTAEGNTGRVVRMMARDADDGLVRIHLWGHTHLMATAEHPILTGRGYVPAGELGLRDWVAMPRYMARSKTFIHVLDHVPIRKMTTRAGAGTNYRHFNAPEGRTKVSVAMKAVPDVVEMTPGVGRILGLFLAEGNTDANKAVWTFNKNEEQTLVADVVALLESEWGVEAHLQHRANNSIRVVVYGTAWAWLFESLCANGAGSKRMHPDVTSGPRDFLEAVLFGWLDGDGHGRRNEVQGVTISRDLALGMFDIAQALGRRPAIRRYQSPTYGSVKHRHARWEISMGAGGKDTFRCRMDDTHVWRSVKGIEREDFEGPVYNLEVEGDNSYVAEGIGVHNCNGYASAAALEQARFVAGMAHVELSGDYTYAILCNGVDRGSNILQAFKLVGDRGTPPASLVPAHTYNPRKLSEAAHAAASRFKMEFGSSYQSWRQIVSAVMLRENLNLSVCVGRTFNTLDGEGVAGVDRGQGNHAVCVGLGLKKSARWGWLVLMRNSWSTRWGRDGFCWLGEAHIEAGSYFESFGVKATVSDPLADLKPPVAPVLANLPRRATWVPPRDFA